MTHTNIITIDGPAASGKGTLARRLAAHLDYFYLDTGKIYRLVGLRACAAGLTEPSDHPEAMAKIATDLAEEFSLPMMNDPALKSDLAGQMASKSGAVPQVRQAVLDLQRHLAENPPGGKQGSVLDGRDCGTVICPQANHKFYITAALNVRANRRYDELLARGDQVDFETVLADMRTRDERDSTRADAAMKPADDAIIIDTSDMSADEAFESVVRNLT